MSIKDIKPSNCWAFLFLDVRLRQRLAQPPALARQTPLL
ncbi:hypothetical protein ACS15_3121 [Ralstonia insidiosa]|uniref:Uncharacterized protein n=1 Tax=Ralstonia insidiosa TaxID=190721 RepID=A0AAC9FQS9_9RALS|nr:hypothetical protein ACS15_3121 [Ralstonia insidiosa]